jgi:hypothetical protein
MRSRFFLVLPLAACVTDDGGGFDPQVDIFLDDRSDHLSAYNTAIALSTYNSSGSTTAGVYSGSLSAIIEDSSSPGNASVLGDMSMTVNFDTTVISGSVTNLRGIDSAGDFGAITGSLLVSGDTDNGTSTTLVATATGALVVPTESGDANVTANLSLDGFYKGSSVLPLPSAIAGDVSGSISGDINENIISGFFEVD